MYRRTLQEQSHTRWLPLVLLALTLAIYLPSVDRGRVVTDSQAAAAGAWRIAATGRPWMEGVDVADLEGTPFPRVWLVETGGGHRVYNRTAGVILAGVPFYFLLNNSPVPSDFRIWVGGIAAASYVAAGGLLMFSALRGKVGDGTAFAGACALLFTTPVWSVAADAMWTHSITMLGVTGAVWATTRARWWTAGAFLGLGIVARPHVAVIAAVVGTYLAWRRRDWRIALRMGLASSMGVLALSLWNRLVFESWGLRGGYQPYVTENLVGSASRTLAYHFGNLLGFLAAPDRGLLVWTPVILLLLPWLLAAWRQMPDWTRGFVLAGLAYSMIQLQINNFVGGQGLYGYRHALELLVCLTPALVYAYKAAPSAARLMVGLLLGVQFAVIAIGATANTYWAPVARLWKTSAYLVACEDHPWAYGVFTAACGLVGALLTVAVMRRSRSSEEAMAE